MTRVRSGVASVALGAAAVAVLVLAAASGDAAEAMVVNGSFEVPDGVAPKGWTLSGGQGRWTKVPPRGGRVVTVTGTGDDSNSWQSRDVGFSAGGLYRLRFAARRLAGSGGTPISGPEFCNRDLGKIPTAWRTYVSHIVVPRRLADGAGRLRFGQWQVKGTVAFDAVELCPASAVHRRRGPLVLGDGESVAARRYVFRAALGGAGRAHSRPLVGHQCRFNTSRWCFGPGSDVVYRHEIAGRRQTAASVDVNIVWYRGGHLAVSGSRDGKTWRPLGQAGKLGPATFIIPKSLLPAEALWVRLAAGPGPASLQVGGYAYQADLDADAGALRGATNYVAVVARDPRVRVSIESLGDCLPGGANRLVAHVQNTSGRAILAAPTVALVGPVVTVQGAARATQLPPGKTRLKLPFDVPGTGDYRLVLTLGPGLAYKAEAEFNVPTLYAASFGRSLPGSSAAAALWWSDSAWKISRLRPAPRQRGPAVLIRTAKNEAEAAQLVVRPSRRLTGFRVRVGALSGPGGASIGVDRIEVLRVRYVPVTRPTDRTGVAAPWPDPLVPLAGPIDLPAGANQPLWVRVKPPANAPAGLYKGKISLSAKGYHAEAELHVYVYDFALPDRMTCQTAFGFSPSLVWRYHNVTDPAQRRVLLDKYFRNFADHHISPYNPAPLDPITVTWENTGNWSGGTIDRTDRHAGKASLKVSDASKTASPGANYAHSIRIPAGGLRLRLHHKAARGHRFLITLRHYDAAGKWMSGRNNDMAVTATGRWTTFDRTIGKGEFPTAARSVRLTLWGALWSDDGATTGTVRYDDVSVTDAGSGKALIAGGDFERADRTPRPRLDFAAWDKAMARAIDEYHFNTFRMAIPGMGGGTFHARHEPSLLGFGEKTPEYQAAFTAYCRTLQEHLRAKGWLDEAFVYWFDEPAPRDYTFVNDGFARLKRAAPGLRRMLTEQVEPALAGGPDIWCPVTPNYNHDHAQARRKQGESFWWYVCTGPKAPYCTLFIDHPATELRVWLWQTWQRQIDGILVWQSNYWTSRTAYTDPKRPQNPYEDPMGWVSGYSTPKGTRRPWGNGDGRFIYPPEAADGRSPGPVMAGPVDSIRWEMLRDGIEDYEYLAILRRLLKRRAGALDAAARTRLEALLTVPPEITSSMTAFTHRPEPILARRHQIAQAIERLSRPAAP